MPESLASLLGRFIFIRDFLKYLFLEKFGLDSCQIGFNHCKLFSHSVIFRNNLLDIISVGGDLIRDALIDAKEAICALRVLTLQIGYDINEILTVLNLLLSDELGSFGFINGILNIKEKA